eukprot:1741107-Amphidinium_carterae.1
MVQVGPRMCCSSTRALLSLCTRGACGGVQRDEAHLANLLCSFLELHYSISWSHVCEVQDQSAETLSEITHVVSCCGSVSYTHLTLPTILLV